MIQLPEPRTDGPVSVEQALRERRSVRNFRESALELAEVAQLLWAGQGQTGPKGGRTAPSAGSLYPLSLYVIAGKVNGLAQALYRYEPGTHRLVEVAGGDSRALLAGAALGQPWVVGAPAVFLISAVYDRMRKRYDDRADRYVHMESGHAAENLQLQAVALGLGSVPIAAFEDDAVRSVLPLPPGEVLLYIVPAGHR